MEFFNFVLFATLVTGIVIRYSNIMCLLSWTYNLEFKTTATQTNRLVYTFKYKYIFLIRFKFKKVLNDHNFTGSIEMKYKRYGERFLSILLSKWRPSKFYREKICLSLSYIKMYLSECFTIYIQLKVFHRHQSLCILNSHIMQLIRALRLKYPTNTW